MVSFITNRITTMAIASTMPNTNAMIAFFKQFGLDGFSEIFASSNTLTFSICIISQIESAEISATLSAILFASYWSLLETVISSTRLSDGVDTLICFASFSFVVFNPRSLITFSVTVRLFTRII